MVEIPAFAHGTISIADAIAKSHAKSIVGGGDTEGALKAAHLTKKFDYVSTGGGASLEFLSGAELPVLKYLSVS